MNDYVQGLLATEHQQQLWQEARHVRPYSARYHRWQPRLLLVPTAERLTYDLILCIGPVRLGSLSIMTAAHSPRF